MQKSRLLSRRICSAIVLSGLFLVTAQGLAAPAIDSGQVLRDVQQTERTIPQKPQAHVDVTDSVRPPLADNGGMQILVSQFTITGQDIIAVEQLQELLAVYVNKEQSLAGIQQAANVITKHFRKIGYPVAQAYVPAQDIKDGIVEITVLVGRVGEVIVKNSGTAREQAVRQQLIALQPGAYITQAKLERAALLANELPNASAKLTLTPGRVTGLTNIIVDIKDNGARTSGYVLANNWGNRFTGSWQVGSAVNIANLTRWGDMTSLSLTTSGKGLVSGGLNYQMPINEGLKFTMGYSQMRYELSNDPNFDPSRDYGTAYTNHVDISYALNRSRVSNLNLLLGYDQKRLEDNYAGYFTSKHSHIYSVGLSSDSNDSWGGGGASANTLTHYQGKLSGTSGLQTVNTGNWHKTAFSVMRQQNITERLSAFLSFSGQMAGGNLDTSERFSLGGATGIRAYPVGEASGDEAWMLNTELRWLLPKKIGKGSVQLVAFYDTGTSYIEKNPTTVSDTNRRSLSGAGLGINYAVPSDYYVKLHYAWKLGSEAAKSDTDKSGRLWLQVVKLF